MTLGISLNNPFDLEINPHFRWSGEIRPSPKPPLCNFDTPFDGIRAGVKNLRNQQLLHGLYNVEDIIMKYAPPSENDTETYIKNVAAALGVDPRDQINLSDPSVLAKFAEAVIVQEQGSNPYPGEVIAQAVDEVIGATQIKGDEA